MKYYNCVQRDMVNDIVFELMKLERENKRTISRETLKKAIAIYAKLADSPDKPNDMETFSMAYTEKKNRKSCPTFQH